MFYSTEILSDKRYALSTVWRAGNTAPGARSTGLRRKAVLEVNLQRACGTIRDPPGAPIALRLQGTLLYGTARIYQEQCRYVLNDSERIQRAIFKFGHSSWDDKLDHNAGKTKSVQIVLPNDPSFDLDFLQLPPFDFDAPNDVSTLSQQRQASWTSMSLQSRLSGGTNSSQKNIMLSQLILDADSSGPHSLAGAGFPYSASGASHVQDSPTPFGHQIGVPEDDNLLADVGLFLDENGNIVEEEPRSEPQLPSFRADKSRQKAATEEDAMPIPDGDEETAHPASEAAAAAAAVAAAFTTPKADPRRQISSSPTVLSKQASLQSRNKSHFVDEITQVPLNQYFSGVTNYVHDMQRVVERKDRARHARRAHDTALNREAAYGFLLGRGIFGVADDVKQHQPEHPLAQMFSGLALEKTLFESALRQAEKRTLAEAVDPTTPVGRGTRAGLGGGGGDDDDQDIELGRQPASALSDNPSSLQWQRHSSLPLASSVHGNVKHSVGLSRSQQPGGVGTSAGRHSSPNFIERYSDDGMDRAVQLPSHSPSAAVLPPAPGLTPDMGGDGANDDDARAGEELRNASTLLALVQKMAADEDVTRGGQGQSQGQSTYHWVAFADVVAPFQRQRPAVVGAFMSLLSLATSRKLRIQQDEADADSVIDRDILIGVKPAKRSKGKKRTFHEMRED